MEKNEYLNIPAFFSRPFYCKKCEAKGFPYSDEESLKNKNKILFLVTSSEVTEEDEPIMHIREQTKVAQRGITPHLFSITDEVQSESEILFKVNLSCGIIGCECSYQFEGNFSIQINYSIGKVAKFSGNELISYYTFRDKKEYKHFMLDSKEPQTLDRFLQLSEF